MNLCLILGPAAWPRGDERVERDVARSVLGHGS